MDGIDRLGVYLVFLCKQSWFLDQHRTFPRLKVERWQIPLAPAYAITAHSSPGRTLRAAIIDLQLGRGVNRISSYVAMTRVRNRSDLLIYRPFDKDVFSQGPPQGPSLLLQHLRGEHIYWKAIEAEHTPDKMSWTMRLCSI